MQDAWLKIAAQTKSTHQRLLHACMNVRNSQNDILADLLKDNRTTDFGRRYGFEDILNADNPLQAFQAQVPIQTYDSIEPYMRSQMSGEKSLLAESVLFYEPTGGSSGGSKFIPYTPAALRLLQAAVEPWLFDLIDSRPALSRGPSYWSVSPAIRSDNCTEDGTRIGAGSDLEFLRDDLQAHFYATMVNAEAIAQATDYQHWQQLTLLTLLMNENLRLISVWSPSFLTTLLRSLHVHRSWLSKTLDNPVAAGLGAIEWLGDPVQNQQAIDRLQASLSVTGADLPVSTAMLWPKLDTISCWTHGPAAGPAAGLQQWFPEVTIQPKGLLATEGVVTIPLSYTAWPVLAVQSGFFEFVDSSNQIVLPENLTRGDYRVLITNACGLYRYDIGDQVRMHGMYKQAPMLEFTGRTSNTSDLAGEKLEESFVSACLRQIPGLSILAPAGSHYCLYIDHNPETDQPELINNHATELDTRLCNNPQYRYARELGQLQPVQLRRIPDLAALHIKWQTDKGQVIGDIKPVALCTDTAFIAYLEKQRQ